MKQAFGLLAATLTFASSAMAADVFVRETRGSDLSKQQIAEVTSLVRGAVRGMPEHQLVNKASDADFVLQPSVLQRGDEMVLRVEKVKDGEILAMSEETINSVNASRSRAMAVTETALQDDTFATDEADRGTMSATSASASDMDASATGMDQQASDSGAMEMNDSAATSNEVPNQVPNQVTEVAPRRTIQSTETTTQAVPAQEQNTGYTPASPGARASVGELTAPSPRFVNPDRAGQFQFGVGPSFGIGMQTDSPMYDLLAAYALDFSDEFVGKIFGDFNLGTGSDSARFINFGVAGEYYPTRELLTFGKPYVGGDIGYAFTRNSDNNTADNIALGAGAGFKFQAAELNWDVNAHYTILLDEITDDTPSVFGVRVALGF